MSEPLIVSVINYGSPSIRPSAPNAGDYEVLMPGIADGTNSENVFLFVNEGEPAPLAHYSYGGASKTIASELEEWDLNDNVVLIGHRIVHGGNIPTESAIITDEVIDNIRCVSPLVLPHSYTNLNGIEPTQQLLPGVTQATILDTSFHQTMTSEVYLYGLSWKYYEELGVCCYGSHGTSYHYIPQCAYSLLDSAEGDSGLVVAHLDNDASICVVRNGQSADASMGMTPLEGLMVDIRGGDIDSGVMSQVAS